MAKRARSKSISSPLAARAARWATYVFGNLEQPIPATRLVLGNSEQADATASIN